MEKKKAMRIPVLFAEMVHDVNEITDKIRTELNRISCNEFENTMERIKKIVSELCHKHRKKLDSGCEGYYEKMNKLFTPNAKLLKKILFKVLAQLSFGLSRKVFDIVLCDCETWHTIYDPQSELSQLIQCAIRLEEMVKLDKEIESNSKFIFNNF